MITVACRQNDENSNGRNLNLITKCREVVRCGSTEWFSGMAYDCFPRLMIWSFFDDPRSSAVGAAESFGGGPAKFTVLNATFRLP